MDVADFDGDGNLDYLLFNPSTHQTAIWCLSGVTLVGGAFGPTLPSSAWALVAVGDIDGDCNPDYVLYNRSLDASIDLRVTRARVKQQSGT
jgi:hypothetical protein